MTRDEEIENIRAVAPYCFETDAEKTWYEIGYADGLKASDAEMLLKGIWHDVSKFPNKALPIIVEIDDDVDPSYDVISIDGIDEKFWKFLVSDRDMTRWAYIKDFLPKTK